MGCTVSVQLNKREVERKNVNIMGLIQFDANVKIGDKFMYGKNILCEVVDIVKTFSTARNEWNEGIIYLARGINTMAKNTFDVSKTTIIRNRVLSK